MRKETIEMTQSGARRGIAELQLRILLEMKLMIPHWFPFGHVQMWFLEALAGVHLFIPVSRALV